MQKVKIAYQAGITTLQRQISELQQILETHKAKRDINWGDVGDLSYVNEQIAQVTDRFMKRGEWA